MNKQELIEEIEDLKDLNQLFGNNPGYIKIDTVMGLVSKLDEPQKVTVPQFVADWIEKNKDSLFGLNYDSVSSEIYDWVYEEEGNLKKLHLACAIGYTIEKEKRYLVKAKGVNEYNCYLNKGLLSKEYFWESKAEIGGCRTKHTRKQLEDDDFGWVFDCPGVEVEEVE